MTWHPTVDDRHRHRPGCRDLRGRQGALPPPLYLDLAGHVRVHCLDLESARGVDAAPDCATPKRRRGDRYRFGRADICRVAVGCGYPRSGSATWRISCLDMWPTLSAAKAGPAPAAPLPRPGVGAAKRAMLMNVAQALGRLALAAGKSAVSLAATLTMVFVLTSLLLLEGPKLRSVILARMPPERAARCVEVAAEVRRPSRAMW